MIEWKPIDHRGVPPEIRWGVASPGIAAPSPIGTHDKPRACDVLFVGPGIWGHGGTESWHMALIPLLRRRGIDVGGYAVSYTEPGPMADRFREAGIPVFSGDEASRKAASLARLVVAWGDTPAVDLIPEGVRVLAVAHGDNSSDWTRRAMALFRPITDRYAAVSKSALDTIPEDCRADAVAIPNGVDEARTLHGDGYRDRIREYYGFHGPTLLSLSRLSPEKRIDVAIRALGNLPGWNLALVGSGIQKADLESLAASLGVQDRVLFLGSHGNVGDFLWAADCLICPSESEGFSLSVAEAMYRGLPAVACPVGCLAGTERGTQVPAGSPPESWAEAVLRAVADRDKALSDHQWARQEFDPDVWADRWADLIRKNLPPPPPPGVGTVLSNMLSFVGVADSGGCSCKADAAEMDRVGPESVLADIDPWTDWLAKKPQAKGIPRPVIRTAIRAACWYCGA